MLDYCLVFFGGITVLTFLIVSIAFLTITSPLWLPIVIPVYIVLRVLGLTGKIKGLVMKVYYWLLFKSDKPRRAAWRVFYNVLCYLFPQEEWKTMNYGYAAQSETGHTIVLSKEEESERFSYQLYHYMATGFKKVTNLNSMTVVEVGSGRGGGLSFIVRNLKPEFALGVDYSSTQVNFCKKTYSYSNINFVCGDAENLPLPENYADMLINVESSHCYGNFEKFVSEVKRVLKPGGIFMVTDFVASEEIQKYEESLKKHLQLVEKKDITQNVLCSLKLDSSRRMELIMNRTPYFLRFILKRFSGCEGSNIYHELETQTTLYLAYKLKKE